TQDNVDVGKEVSDQHYIVLPLWSSISSTYKSSNDKPPDDKPKDDTGSKTIEGPVIKEDQAYRDELDRLMSQEKKIVMQRIPLERINAASTSGTFTADGPSSSLPNAFIPSNTILHVDQDDSQIPNLDDTSELQNHPKDQILGDLKSAVQIKGMAKKSYGAHALVSYIYKQRRNKKDEIGIVVRNKARLAAQGHRQEEGIDYDEVFAHVARIEAIRIFLAFGSYMKFIVYQIDVKRLQVKQSEEVIFISQDKYVAEILKKFDFSSLKTTSTPIKTLKPLVKDEVPGYSKAFTSS
nr:ribonuclease H-like domain-containing protein [Tanacetum cinerariifolium]